MVQQFTSGATVIWIRGEQMIYAFGADSHEVSTFRRK
jgi:hypothetical protein